MKLTDSKEEQLFCLNKAFEIEPDNWRAAIALAKHYLSENLPSESKNIIEPFFWIHTPNCRLSVYVMLSV